MEAQAAQLIIPPAPDSLGSSPYLDTVSSDGGGASQTRMDAELAEVEKYEIAKELWYRSLLCNRIANKFRGARTGKVYYKFMPCLRWWCDECGKRGGRINLKRMSRVLDHITLDPHNTLMRQAVFTVPAADAEAFKSRAALNSLLRMAEKIIKKRFPGLPSIAVVHLFGDKGGIRFHPHVHIITLDKRGQVLMLAPEDLEQLREQWRFALQAFLKHPVKTVNLHFSFVKERGKMIHRIRYITRPMPGPHQYHDMKKNIDLLMFCVVDMQGFIFVRYFNGSRNKAIVDPTQADEIEECRNAAGESLIFVLHGQIARAEFNKVYGVWNTEELSPGFYRLRGP